MGDSELNLVRMSPRKSMSNDFGWTVPFVLKTSFTSCPLIPVLASILSCAYVFPANHSWVWRVTGGGEGDGFTLYNLVLFLVAAWGVPSLSLSGWADRNLAELWNFGIMCSGIYFGYLWTLRKNVLKFKIWRDNWEQRLKKFNFLITVDIQRQQFWLG